MPTQRITDRFEKVRSEGRKALVTYIMGGDPDLETSYQALCALRDNGADIIQSAADRERSGKETPGGRHSGENQQAEDPLCGG